MRVLRKVNYAQTYPVNHAVRRYSEQYAAFTYVLWHHLATDVSSKERIEGIFAVSVFTNIKKRRLELNMSQQDLALALGYRSRSSIAKIEAGEVDLPFSKLADLSRILDIPLERLVSSGKSSPAKTGSEENEDAAEGFGPRDPRKTIAVVLAGGKSTRNLKNIPNQFITVLGKPVIVYCLETLQKHPMVDEIYVVCLKGWEDILSAYTSQYGINKIKTIIPGGATGALSVLKALEELEASHAPEDIVLLQESTKPLVSEEVISRVIHECKERGNASASQSMREYIQFEQVDGKLRSLRRDGVVSLQSPEAYTLQFMRAVFTEASEQGKKLDMSWFGQLVFGLGHDLNLVEGAQDDIKIVRQEDLATFSALVKLYGQEE